LLLQLLDRTLEQVVHGPLTVRVVPAGQPEVAQVVTPRQIREQLVGRVPEHGGVLLHGRLTITPVDLVPERLEESSLQTERAVAGVTSIPALTALGPALGAELLLGLLQYLDGLQC